MKQLNIINRLKKILLTGLLVLCCCTNHAQNCTDANVASLPGKWELNSSWGSSSDTRSDILKEKPIADAIMETIRKNFPWSVAGGRIAYGTFGSADDGRPIPIQKICNDYYADINFNAYGCNTGKIYIEEGQSELDIKFNGLPFHFEHSFYDSGPNSTDVDKDPETDKYEILHWLPDVKDSYFDYIKDAVDGKGTKPGLIYRYRTIIKPGKLPYSLMSKKEFYEKWKKKNLAEIRDLETGKKNYTKELAGNALLPGILKQQDQYIAIDQNYINKMDGILKSKSAEQLAQPAYEGEQEGLYFESLEASVYKAYIVKPNLAYYNNKVSKNSPQVITICQIYRMGVDNQGNRTYSDEKFYKALEDMNIFELLTQKLKPLIVQ